MQRHVDFVTTRGGAAVSGASVLVKTYPAGATATIYSDDGVTATTNPLTTDANGQFSFYAEDGRYTLVISKTGVITQQTLTDSVLLLDPDDGEASIDSADVFFTPSGSGAIAGDAQAALRLSVHTSQYSTQGNYETARDALTGTTGVNNLDVSGNLVVTGTITGTVAGNIAESLIDAKGDLIAGTAADTAGRLAAGTNEHRLVADSAQTVGLKYVPDTTNYAVAAKGDLLVGTAADTVAALTVGANDTVLLADSAQSGGMKWANEATFKSALNLEADTDFRRPAVLATEVASTSGTSIDFTGIPSWVKKITLNLVGVSTSGTSIPMIQLGDSGGVEPTGYSGTAANQSGTVVANSGGFQLSGAHAATLLYHGSATLTLQDSSDNTWVCSFALGLADTSAAYGGGSKSLSGALDRIRLTTVGGTETFDAGAVNILYE